MSEIRVKELRIGKGRTKQNGEEWIKDYIEVLIDTEGLDPKTVEIKRQEADFYLHHILGMDTPKRSTPQPPEPSPEPIPEEPQFNPEDLIQHQGWKNRSKPGGGYTEGSLAWGWEFADKFSAEIIEALPLTIDQYRFTLSDNKKLVNVQKATP